MEALKAQIDDKAWNRRLSPMFKLKDRIHLEYYFWLR